MLPKVEIDQRFQSHSPRRVFLADALVAAIGAGVQREIFSTGVRANSVAGLLRTSFFVDWLVVFFSASGGDAAAGPVIAGRKACG